MRRQCAQHRQRSDVLPGVTSSDDIAELQRQLLQESSHIDSLSSTRASLDDVSSFTLAVCIALHSLQVLRCMLDRYMAHQARLASLVKSSFKEACVRQKGTNDKGAVSEYDGSCSISIVALSYRCAADIIAAIHSNVPMNSVASAIRDSLMPKFPQFYEVMNYVVPSLGEARTMQVSALVQVGVGLLWFRLGWVSFLARAPMIAECYALCCVVSFRCSHSITVFPR